MTLIREIKYGFTRTGAMRKSSKNILHRCKDIVGKDVAIEFVKDNKLSDGQCKIETPYGVVDCGVDTQLSALLKDIRSLV